MCVHGNSIKITTTVYLLSSQLEQAKGARDLHFESHKFVLGTLRRLGANSLTYLFIAVEKRSLNKF